jgi:hypothetical protein
MKKKPAPARDSEPLGIAHRIELVEINTLKPHPENYLEHPDDELDHIIESIRRNGFYRNVVVARDGTILAGHGVTKAAEKMGLKRVPVLRLDLDPNESAALKILTGDNELNHLAVRNDRKLTEILKTICNTDVSKLLGTGYDENMLAMLAMVTRPASEIASVDAAKEWVGMPAYDSARARSELLQITVSFETAEDRAAFARVLGLTITDKTKAAWYPQKAREDLASLEFTQQPNAEAKPTA